MLIFNQSKQDFSNVLSTNKQELEVEESFFSIDFFISLLYWTKNKLNSPASLMIRMKTIQ